MNRRVGFSLSSYFIMVQQKKWAEKTHKKNKCIDKPKKTKFSPNPCKFLEKQIKFMISFIK